MDPDPGGPKTGGSGDPDPEQCLAWKITLPVHSESEPVKFYCYGCETKQKKVVISKGRYNQTYQEISPWNSDFFQIHPLQQEFHHLRLHVLLADVVDPALPLRCNRTKFKRCSVFSSDR
jgi:hypothetical protein